MTQKNEIIWNIVNSGLAGALVFLGACSTGQITLNTIIFSLVAAGAVAVSQFNNYWKTQEGEYSTNKLFCFIK